VIGYVCCIFYLASRHEDAFSNDISSKGSHAKAVASINGFSGCGGVSNGSRLTFPLAQHNPTVSLLSFEALQYRHIVVIGPISKFSSSQWCQ